MRAKTRYSCRGTGYFLGWITQDYATVINIAGTHGKTTTTAMCALILMEANLNPTVHLGAELSAFGQSTVRMGRRINS